MCIIYNYLHPNTEKVIEVNPDRKPKLEAQKRLSVINTSGNSFSQHISKYNLYILYIGRAYIMGSAMPYWEVIPVSLRTKDWILIKHGATFISREKQKIDSYTFDCQCYMRNYFNSV